MPVDPSVYSQFKPADISGALERGQQMAESSARLSDLGRQRKVAMRDDAIKQNDQAIYMVGTELEGVAFLPPEKQPAAYPKARERLIAGGWAKPEDIPEQFDPSFVRGNARALLSNPKWLQIKEAQAKIRDLESKSKNDPIDRDLDRRLKESTITKNLRASEKERAARMIPAGEASKIGNLLGAVDSSHKIEVIGSDLPSGKVEGVRDWFAAKLDNQPQGRAKSLADIATQRNETMSRISGANVTPDEKGRVLEGIPTNWDAPEMFTGKSRSTVDNVLGKAKAEIEALDAAGYDTSKMRANYETKKQEIDLFRREYDRKMAERKKAAGSAVAGEVEKPVAPRMSEDEFIKKFLQQKASMNGKTN